MDRIPVGGVRRARPIHYGWQSGYYVGDGAVHFVLPVDALGRTSIEEAEGVYLAGAFNGWEAAKGQRAWKLVNRPHADPPRMSMVVPLETAMNWSFQPFKFLTGTGRWLEVPLDAPNAVVDDEGNRNHVFNPDQTGRHEFVFEAPASFTGSREPTLTLVDGDDEEQVALRPGPFLKRMGTDLPLGALCGDTETTFRVFAPLASRVLLVLREARETGAEERFEMELVENVAWEVSVAGNRHGWWYAYRVDGRSMEAFSRFDSSFPILDPYALTIAAPDGPGMVVDVRKLEKPRHRFQAPRWHELVIMEGHVRDLAAHAPVEASDIERMGFRGLTKWVREQGSYLRAVGCNAVELQPIQAFDSPTSEAYAWGYMPINYFSPAPQYTSSGPGMGVFREFSELVQAFHDAGIAVILDVVYNHVGEPNHLQYLDRHYYFLLDPQGDYLNYSGCGNTLDCGTPMVRRLIVDSLRFLIEYFDVDGFRFDLGELIGSETLSHIENELKAIKPSVILIAEPWSFRGNIVGELRETGIASWNDGYREFLKRYVRNEEGAEGLLYHITGSREQARFPAQTINYVESHDDRCWIDEITENEDGSGAYPTFNDRRRTHLMISVLMMSIGVPMIHQGIDMLKSKDGKRNTYLDGETNALHYERLQQFPATHDYVRAWIAFRKGQGQSLLCLADPASEGYFSWTTSEHGIALLFNADRSQGKQRLLFAINPGSGSVQLPMLEGIQALGLQIADHERFAPGGLETALVEVKERHLIMPPLSCALWWA